MHRHFLKSAKVFGRADSERVCDFLQFNGTGACYDYNIEVLNIPVQKIQAKVFVLRKVEQTPFFNVQQNCMEKEETIMKVWKKITALVLSFTVAASLAACGSGSGKSETTTTDSETTAEGTTAESKEGTESAGNYRDTLNVSYNAQPATFDPHVTGATATREIDRNVFEGLFEEDADGNPQPQLCENYEANDDNTEWTFKLREGILFHNGEEMKAKDAVASLNRWLDKNAIARKSIPTGYFEEVDDYTIKISLEQPCLLLPYVLCNYAQFSAILPASVIEAAGDENLSVEQLIGTGPFKFKEWVVDSHVTLERFEDYKPFTEESDGAWGNRTAYVDTVNIYFVTDTTTRLNGLESGEYDISTSLAFTDYQKASSMSGIEVMTENWNSITITMNKSDDSIMSDPKWRQIISYCMNAEEILEGGYSTMTDYVPYYADACYFDQNSQWYADVSSVQYQDLEKAKELLEEVGYDGTPIRMMTTQAYPELYNITLILQQQLEAIGVSVDLQVYDWGTMLTKISDTTAFDLYPMNYPASSAPVCINYLTKTNASGFTNDATLNDYILQMNSCSTVDEAKNFWYETVMPYCAEQVFILHLGTYDIITGVSDQVEGFENYYGMKLWGVRVAE